jgi:hypothetical protein
MNISPNEAEQALADIQAVMKKNKRLISSSGAYQFLILWGTIWFLGFLCSQFIQNQWAGYIWMGLDILGGLLSVFIGIRIGRRVHNASLPSSKRIGAFWGMLFLFCLAAILVIQPSDYKQMSMILILFVMIGWSGMSLLFSVVPLKLGVVITVLALLGYFFLPNYFFLLMSLLGGGGMIAFGLYIRYRW